VGEGRTTRDDNTEKKERHRSSSSLASFFVRISLLSLNFASIKFRVLYPTHEASLFFRSFFPQIVSSPLWHRVVAFVCVFVAVRERERDD